MDVRDRPAPAARARRRLACLGAFGAYGVGLSALYAGAGVGLPCPLRLVTGWECPLCGGTRLGAALLHGRLATAFAENPVLLVGLGVLVVLGVLWSSEALGGPVVRLPRRWSGRLRAVHPTRRLVVVLVAAVAYTLLRNLL